MANVEVDATFGGKPVKITVYCAYDELVPVEKLVAHPDNPNKHSKKQIKLLSKVIYGNGWRNPIKVSNLSGYITGGHGRLMAARELGMSVVPVDYQDYKNTAEEYQDLVADNRISELAELDQDASTQILKKLKEQGKDIEYAGYTDEDLNKLLNIAGNVNTGQDDGFNEDGVKGGISQLGDIWYLGPHRLICGDCTDSTVVDKLFDGSKCDSVVTDPPYGVDYVEKQNNIAERTGAAKSKHKSISGDSGMDYRSFFGKFMAIVPVQDYNTLYVFMLGSNLHNVRLAMDDVGITWGDYLIWVKDNFTLSRKDYHPRHEFIAYGWRGKHKFYGDRTNCTILEYPKPKKSDLHPTMKPVELVAKLICDGSPKGGIVYDAFMGSGTTMIAADQVGRVCYGCELEPHYCDVDVERYRQLKGNSGEIYLLRGDKKYTYDEAKALEVKKD